MQTNSDHRRMFKICLFIISMMSIQLYGSEPLPAPQPDLYQERYRPQFHFTARQWTAKKLNPGMREDGWLNDINGLIFYDGEYHAFAQRWNKCWIHAVSRDLLHWTELPPAFWEDKQFGGVQSGSAVIDKTNLSGLATSENNPVMVAFWSSTDAKSQCISYSNDKGRTWTKYDKNPVLLHADRDPKVFWYEPEKKWVMVLFGPPGGYLFFSSKDLKVWQQTSFLAGYFECPDMFELPIDGDKKQTKWVVMNGNGQYTVGSFDGSTFKPETPKRLVCGGPNYYATQTWNNMEDADGRRIQLAWMQGGKYPDMPFNQQMTFPCELTLRSHAGTLQVYRKPIAEIDKLTRATHSIPGRTLAAGEELKLEGGELLRIKAVIELSDNTDATLHLRGENISFSNERIALRDREAKLSAESGKHPRLETLEILLDRTSIEVFGNDGEVNLAGCFLPACDCLSLHCYRGEVKLKLLEIDELDSIWKDIPKNQ